MATPANNPIPGLSLMDEFFPSRKYVRLGEYSTEGEAHQAMVPIEDAGLDAQISRTGRLRHKYEVWVKREDFRDAVRVSKGKKVNPAKKLNENSLWEMAGYSVGREQAETGHFDSIPADDYIKRKAEIYLQKEHPQAWSGIRFEKERKEAIRDFVRGYKIGFHSTLDGLKSNPGHDQRPGPGPYLVHIGNHVSDTITGWDKAKSYGTRECSSMMSPGFSVEDRGTGKVVEFGRDGRVREMARQNPEPNGYTVEVGGIVRFFVGAGSALEKAVEYGKRTAKKQATDSFSITHSPSAITKNYSIPQDRFIDGRPPVGTYMGSHRRNPASDSAAMFESFHGTPSTTEEVLIEEEHYHGNLAELGVLVSLTVETVSGMEVKLGFDEPGGDSEENPVRKTRDYWAIEGRYAHGWEEVTEEATWKDARAQLKVYRENEPGTSFRARRKREKLDAGHYPEGHHRNPGEGNEGDARELELFIENDADLYRQQTVPIMKNLLIKMAKGVYSHSKAVQLWMYLMENGAKKYVKEFGSAGDKWHDMFNVPTRKMAAESFADSFETEVEYGNYDNLAQQALPKKLQGWSGKQWKRNPRTGPFHAASQFAESALDTAQDFLTRRGPVGAAYKAAGKVGGYLDRGLGKVMNPGQQRYLRFGTYFSENAPDEHGTISGPRRFVGHGSPLTVLKAGKGKRNLVSIVDGEGRTLYGWLDHEDILTAKAYESLHGQGSLGNLRNPRTVGPGPVLLCSNESGTQLYFMGGDQSLDLAQLKIPVRDLADIGSVTQIEYHTKKYWDGTGKRPEVATYYHKFGEEVKSKRNRPLPTLIYDSLNQKLSLAGGDYRIEQPLVGLSPGIQN